MIMDTKNSYRVLKDIVLNERVTGKIVDEFSIFTFSRNELLSMLYYTGILTIDSGDLADIVFRVPNYVIKELYYVYFLEHLTDKFNFELDTEEISSSIHKMARDGDIVPFIRSIERLLGKLSNRDYLNFSEKYIKAIFFAYLTLSNVYFVKSETEQGKKYMDMTCIGKNFYNIKHHWLIGLKYIKKNKGKAELENKKD